ncbi:MAG: glycosyltransferase family 39 protein [Ardenticatenales bacterium]|nr:glycosyltransferase family 39 protein [Ardenticatenales bacterium]
MKDKRVWGVLLAFALLALLNSVMVPPFEKPDEIWHYAVIQHIATTGELPWLEPQTTARWRQQGGQAPIYYLAAALLTSGIDQSDFPAIYDEQQNPYAAIGLPGTGGNHNYQLHGPADRWPWHGVVLALHLVRFFSVALGVLTLCAIYQTLRRLLGESRALLGMALWAFLPQFIFISSSASNDNAIIVTASLLLWRLVALLHDAPATPAAPDPRRLRMPFAAPAPYLLLGVLLALALLSKLSALALLPLTGFTLLMVAYRTRDWRILLQGGLLVGGPVLLLAGWWYLRNYLLYGDWLAINIWQENVEPRTGQIEWRDITGEWQSMEFSFWGMFGWFNIPYPTWLYRLFEGIELLALLGLMAGIWQRRALLRQMGREWSQHWRLQALALLGLWLAALSFSWLSFMRVTLAAQGRLFFPAAIALTLLLVLGLQHWRTRVGQPILLWGLVGGLFGLSVLTPWWLLQPAYTPSTPLSTLPQGVTPLELQFGEGMRLEGYTIDSTLFAPSTPMELTLYWRVLQPMDEDYSIAVKGFGRDEELIARGDSFPDGGRWQTSLWQPGQLIADRWKIWFSGRTATPTVARLTVDVYRFDMLEMLPASVGGQPVSLPFHFSDVVVREPGASPTAPQSFLFRPVEPRITLQENRVEAEFTWEAGAPMEKNYQAFFHLSSALDQPPIAQVDFEPVGGDFPTRHWWPGDRLPDRVQLPLPADVPPGEYLLLMGLYDLENQQKLAGETDRTTWSLGRLRWDGETWALSR